MTTLTPKQIVQELDKFIIGQNEAKQAVAIALRDRWRRLRLPDELRSEVKPKNILMIGPTGVGKTEIARRLAKLTDSPFLKIEATKYTEIGYVGRDVESMIRELIDVAIKQAREKAIKEVEKNARKAAEERILDALLPLRKDEYDSEKSSTREIFRKKLNSGELDERDIEIELQAASVGVEIMAPPGMEEMTSQLQNLLQSIGSDKTKVRKMKIREALKVVQEEEASKLVNEEEIRMQAVKNVEQNGIIFIDEIDKITRRSEQGSHGGEVSREGVQRDLLPLIEGCTVFTKFGMVKTDHILFIASGAFHLAKPSDLIPELQGRLPIRVELSALTAEDFIRILTEPNASLTEQYSAMMAVEGVKLTFTKDGVQRIAEIASEVNKRLENIGARRLHTVMERLLQETSFNASELKGKTITINGKYVDKQLKALIKDQDLSQYIL